MVSGRQSEQELLFPLPQQPFPQPKRACQQRERSTRAHKNRRAGRKQPKQTQTISKMITGFSRTNRTVRSHKPCPGNEIQLQAASAASDSDHVPPAGMSPWPGCPQGPPRAILVAVVIPVPFFSPSLVDPPLSFPSSVMLAHARAVFGFGPEVGGIWGLSAKQCSSCGQRAALSTGRWKLKCLS